MASDKFIETLVSVLLIFLERGLALLGTCSPAFITNAWLATVPSTFRGPAYPWFRAGPEAGSPCSLALIGNIFCCSSWVVGQLRAG